MVYFLGTTLAKPLLYPIFSFLFLSAWLLDYASAQWASTFPSPMALIDKSPGLSSWMAIDPNMTSPSGRWPFFWGRQDMGWAGGIRVDGVPYQWAGDASYPLAKNLAAVISPTRSVFTIQAGPVMFNLTFLSPIEPSDWVLQSLPFGYLAIDVWSNDGSAHSVQLYSDITAGQWVTSNAANEIIWKTNQTKKSTYHQAERKQKASMGENNGFAEDATIYFAMSSSTPSLTWQTGSWNITRTLFGKEGKLANTADDKFRQGLDDWPVLAFATDLGSIQKTSSPIVFGLGLVRDPVITYRMKGVLQDRVSLFWTRWNSVADAIDDFLADYPNALTRAVALDTKIMTDANKISGNYSDIAAASLRQTMAPLEFTTSRLPNGGFDGDVRVFMKDLGVSQRINPVDTLYAAFPAYLYLNTSLAGRLLEPLLEFQSSSDYTNLYAAPDLGSWPDALGNTTDQKAFAIEHCGSMLIMALAHAQKSGDGSLIQRYQDVLLLWADYLVANALRPSESMSADYTSKTTSNLALKGITGIWAMSKINQALESVGASSNLTQTYLATAKDYAKQWQSRAFVGDHISSDYGGSQWGLIYNLYAPKLLNSDLIPQTIFDAQGTWYRDQMPKARSYGFPFDQSEGSRVKAHWTLLTAGSVSESPVIHDLIAQVHKRTFSQALVNFPNPSTYHTDSGAAAGELGKASPVMGAAFSIMALSLPERSITVRNTPASKRKVAPIVGGVVGGLAFLVLACIGVFAFLRRRREANHKFERVLVDMQENNPEMDSTTILNPTMTPFTEVPTTFTASSNLYTPTAKQHLHPSSLSESYSTDPTQGQRSPPFQSTSTSTHSYPPSSMSGDRKNSLFPSSQASRHIHNQSSLTQTDISSSIALSSPGRDNELREEVAQLRRELSTIRRQEPPPGYSD